MRRPNARQDQLAHRHRETCFHAQHTLLFRLQRQVFVLLPKLSEQGENGSLIQKLQRYPRASGNVGRQKTYLPEFQDTVSQILALLPNIGLNGLMTGGHHTRLHLGFMRSQSSNTCKLMVSESSAKIRLLSWWVRLGQERPHSKQPPS